MTIGRYAHTTRRRKWPLILISIVAATTVVVSLAATAEAATPTKKSNTDTYSRSGTIPFPENGECIRYIIDGTITYTARKGQKDTGSNLGTYFLQNIKLKSPRLRVNAVKYDTVTHGCTTRTAKFKGLGVRQVWAGYSCNFNPSISVGLPWGVSFSAWPSCGDKRAASYGSKFTNLTGGTQLRTDSMVKFADYTYSLRSTDPRSGPCYGGRVKLALQTGSIDSVKTSPRSKVCLTPKFN